MVSGDFASIFGLEGFNAAAFAHVPEYPPEVLFREALASAGIVTSQIIGDGQIHRVNGRDDNKRSAWYVLHLNDELPAGAYGDWREGETQIWHAAMGNRTLTEEEHAAIKSRLAEAKQLRDEEQARWHEDAAEKAIDDLEAATDAVPDHPYLLNKKVKPYGGLRQLKGNLLIPMVNGDGKTVRSYQSIAADGTKRFLKDGQAKGCYHLIPGDTATIYVGEGYATCATVFEATGCSVYVAFSAGNLANVAKLVRKMHPASRIVILGDNDNAGRDGSAKAAEAVSCEVVMATGFKPDGKGNDFNDMGVEATREALGVIIKKVTAEKTDTVERTIEEEFADIPPHLFDLSSVGGMLERIQKYTLETSTVANPPAAAVGALALVGTVLANKVQTNTGLRSNMQFVLVAGTGTGKEHPRKINKYILMAAGMEAHIGGEEIASGQGLMTSAAHYPERLFQLDEFGMLLQAIASDKAGSWQKAIMSAYMKLHSGAGSIVAGQEKADQKNHPRVDVRYPCVNLFATTTANELVPALKSAQVASGFANRMVFVLTKSRRQKRNMKARLTDPPVEILKWIIAVRGYHHNLMGTTAENPVTVNMDDAATKLFDAWDDEIMCLQDKGPIHEAMYVRAWEHASKLAMIVAMSRMTTQALTEFSGCQVTGADATWSIEFVRFSFAQMIRLIEVRVSDTEFEGQCKDVTRLIHRAGEHGMTERELDKSSRTFRGLDGLARDKILAVLQRTEQIQRVRIATVGGKGRPRLAWVLSDYVPTTDDKR